MHIILGLYFCQKRKNRWGKQREREKCLEVKITKGFPVMRCGCISLTRNRLIKMPNQKLRKLQPGDRLELASSAARPRGQPGGQRGSGSGQRPASGGTKGQRWAGHVSGCPDPEEQLLEPAPFASLQSGRPNETPPDQARPHAGPQVHTPQPHDAPARPAHRTCPLRAQRRPEGHTRGPRPTRQPRVTGAVCVCAL